MKKPSRGYSYNTEKDLAYNALWAATYGSFFALQVQDHMRQGNGAPEPDDYDRFVEESGTVADEAAERGQHR